jgi:hypothetical protein
MLALRQIRGVGAILLLGRGEHVAGAELRPESADRRCAAAEVAAPPPAVVRKETSVRIRAAVANLPEVGSPHASGGLFGRKFRNRCSLPL